MPSGGGDKGGGGEGERGGGPGEAPTDEDGHGEVLPPARWRCAARRDLRGTDRSRRHGSHVGRSRVTRCWRGSSRRVWPWAPVEQDSLPPSLSPALALAACPAPRRPRGGAPRGPAAPCLSRRATSEPRLRGRTGAATREAAIPSTISYIYIIFIIRHLTLGSSRAQELVCPPRTGSAGRCTLTGELRPSLSLRLSVPQPRPAADWQAKALRCPEARLPTDKGLGPPRGRVGPAVEGPAWLTRHSRQSGGG